MGTSTTADLTETERIKYEREEAKANRQDVRSRVEDAVKVGGDPRILTAAAALALWALHVEVQYVVGAFILAQGAKLLPIVVRIASKG